MTIFLDKLRATRTGRRKTIWYIFGAAMALIALGEIYVFLTIGNLHFGDGILWPSLGQVK